MYCSMNASNRACCCSTFAAAGLVASFLSVRCVRSCRPFCCGWPGSIRSCRMPNLIHHADSAVSPVVPVEAKGVPFDPAHHEAMGHVASDEHEPNVVVEEHQRGYRLNDRLLRPALVSVAKPAAGNLAKDKTRD